MKLSILIPSLQNRSKQRTELINCLMCQLGNEVYHYTYEYDNHIVDTFTNGIVEIVSDIDNKEVSTGEKRNRLLNRSIGDYVVFIDDDDDIENYYIEQLLIATKSNADCFAINGIMTTDGAKEIKWRISKDYQNITIKENGKDLYLRKTNHIAPVKREIALKIGFPNKSNAEDKAYSDGINKYLNSEHIIKMPLYHYKYSTKNKEY